MEIKMIKTTGLEFKEFYFDEAYWPEGWFHDDGEITIDGKEDTPIDENIPDSSSVVINGGTIFKGDYDAGDIDFETHFKRWRKAQTSEYVTVIIPKGKSDELKAFIKSLK
jgi:hypothetical protein